MAYRFKKGIRAAAALLAALVLLTAFPAQAWAEKEPSDLLEAAFELLEEGNPFVARYEQLTGREVTPLFPYGVPYFFGGLTGAKGNGWFYLAYPDYFVKQCGSGSGYFKAGKLYFYGLDCVGFTRHVYKACGKQMPAWDQLKDTLQIGDLLVVKHEASQYRHVMMYMGTLREFGYTAEEEPALAAWLDYPLVIHCGLSPFYGERFQKLIDAYPEKYGKCTTTDGGVAVSILGVPAEEAPEHGHVQNTDYSWFTMNDGGYQLTAVSLDDVKYYCWYRQ